MSRVARAVEQLEREFTSWLRASGAVATGFGRSALYLALEAAGVRGGDVLVPDFTCVQVPEAVRRVGARPVFYRIGRDLSVTAPELEAAFTAQTRAVIVVHYFGRAQPEIAALADACRRRQVPLIEDCALALGATSADGRAVGTFGELAVFSFTKSDWCYGGGMAASTQPELVEKLRALRDSNLRSWKWLSLRYGWLRRADFAANRPSRARVAEFAGRWLQRLVGPRVLNFYDAGRFDAAMPDFAARRTLRILSSLARVTERRRQILAKLEVMLGPAGSPLFLNSPKEGDTAAFVLIECPAARSEEWLALAAREGITLRRTWPAYQAPEPEQQNEVVLWLGQSVLVLELDFRIDPCELRRIAECLASVSKS